MPVVHWELPSVFHLVQLAADHCVGLTVKSLVSGLAQT